MADTHSPDHARRSPGPPGRDGTGLRAEPDRRIPEVSGLERLQRLADTGDHARQPQAAAIQRRGGEDEKDESRDCGCDGRPVQRVAAGGLPEGLRRNMESMSGHDLGGVKVHYNSPEPAKVGARAYAQGRDIHLGKGQEKHLPHETWHVVQQAQGRVKPTGTLAGGQPLNDSPGLEAEADRMGATAMQKAEKQ